MVLHLLSTSISTIWKDVEKKPCSSETNAITNKVFFSLWNYAEVAKIHNAAPLTQCVVFVKGDWRHNTTFGGTSSLVSHCVAAVLLKPSQYIFILYLSRKCSLPYYAFSCSRNVIFQKYLHLKLDIANSSFKINKCRIFISLKTPRCYWL